MPVFESSSSSAGLPWWEHRPTRSGAQRRAQAQRANAQVIGKLLQNFAALQHRGCCNSRLVAALVRALSPGAAAAAAATAVAPHRPPGIFYNVEAEQDDEEAAAPGVWEPLPTPIVLEEVVVAGGGKTLSVEDELVIIAFDKSDVCAQLSKLSGPRPLMK